MGTSATRLTSGVAGSPAGKNQWARIHGIKTCVDNQRNGLEMSWNKLKVKLQGSKVKRIRPYYGCH